MNVSQAYIDFPSTYVANASFNIQPDLKNWLHCFSSHVDCELEDNGFIYPEKFAKGYAKVHVIEPGLSYRLVNYKLNTDIEYNCEPAVDFHLLIYFYHLSSADKIQFEVGEHRIENEGKSYRASVMTNTRIKQKLILKKGTEVKGLTIQLNEEWLNDKIKNSNSNKYELLKQNNFVHDVINAKHQKILADIFNNHEDASLPVLFVNTRVLRLLEAFLENILKRNSVEPMLSISSKDFESILKIEGLLLENYGDVFPKIEKLARLALMSESKLKKIYKQAFGMGLYEYYQKNRMHKAKELLSSGEYSVSQVGTMLGYHNLSNFSASFKKEFNQLPRDHYQVD
ncbi:MAG: helix-turn-helix transcriptional regulator [Bacteroidota bacterium]|nr:helix-turn-helix transcriptional regulator [Bacteroidota bacterium]